MPLRPIPCLALLAVIGLAPFTRSSGQEDSAAAAVGSQLAQLKDPDMEVRIAALRELMTSLDPRLPEALLPLLKDEGNSIRRLAARSIGSRWWQIPDESIPEFVGALKRNAQSEYLDEANMARRAIGLLERSYSEDMFSRSANKRWVIYERRGLPCLIDTESETEELLGWSTDDNYWLAAAWGNEALESSASWHTEKETVALDVTLHRKASTIWFWTHRQGLHKLSVADFAVALGMVEDDIFAPGGFFAEIRGWKDDECLIGLFFSTQSGDDFAGHEATLAWDVNSQRLRLISRKPLE